jgi:hypothetical protein
LSPNRPLRITSGRHPFQVAVVGAVPVVIASLLISGTRPTALLALGPWAATAWLVLCGLGGVGVMVGAFWRGRLQTALAVEGGALTMVASMLALWVTVVTFQFGLAALVSGGLVTGITTAAWWRVGQLFRDLRKLRAASHHPRIVRYPLLAEDGEPQPGTGGKP